MRTVQGGLLATLLLAGCGDKGNDDTGAGGSGFVECEHGNSRASEVCDGYDNDCDGEIDEGLPTATWWTDADGDGHGDPATGEQHCGTPSGLVDNDDDCDDTDSALRPGAEESCDGVDNDCDGLTDSDDGDVTGADEYFVDADGDGHGIGWSFFFCDDPGEGWSTSDGDCDDGDATVGATVTWYPDADGDGFGSSDEGEVQCDPISGYVRDGSDCDDGDDGINPDAEEICHDFVDNDCDGTANGCLPWQDDISISDADVSITHGTSGAARYLSGTDIDGDGVNELIGSTPSGGSYSLGQIFVYDGPESGDALDSGDTKITITGTGSSGGYYLGYDTMGIGDTDGDGYAEIITNDSNGYVTLYDGPYSRAMYSTNYVSLFYDGPDAGTSGTVFGSGDFDDDGKEELVVGDPRYTYAATYSGMVWLVDDAAKVGTSYLSSVYTTFIGGDSSYDYFGSTVVDLGDTDGDGVHDLGVAAYYSSDYSSYGGAFYVFDGATLSRTTSPSDAESILYGSYASGNFGWDAGSKGDFDGDGYADVLVSAPGNATYGATGAAFLYEGPPSAIGTGVIETAADITFYATSTQPYFGYRVAFAGDLDEDGKSDVVIGHLGNSAAGSYAGAALIWYGDSGAGTRKDSTADAAILPTASSGYLGWDVAGVGDISGDGIDDIAVGWYSYDYIYAFFGGSL